MCCITWPSKKKKKKGLIPNPFNDSMGEAKLYWLWSNMGFWQGQNRKTKEITIQALVNLVIFSRTYILWKILAPWNALGIVCVIYLHDDDINLYVFDLLDNFFNVQFHALSNQWIILKTCYFLGSYLAAAVPQLATSQVNLSLNS